MNKIAILLMVHKNENQVNRLIKHLSKDFDVYVHIDKRSSIKIIQQSNVFVYQKYKAYWGSFNIVLASLMLLKEAHKTGYERYILLSGQDLPIKSNQEIKSFFENNDSEYIDTIKIPREDGWPEMERLTYYHVDSKYHGMDHISKYKIFYRLQRKLYATFSRYFPRKLDYIFYAGPQWVNFTHKCADKIFEYLENDKKYIKRFNLTSIADEFFFQTIVNHVKGLKIEKNCLRYIDWETGPEHPRILRMEDYDKIMQSGHLFARKFEEEVDKEIIDRIYQVIGE